MKKVIVALFAVLMVLASCSMEDSSNGIVSFDVGENSRGNVSVIEMDVSYYVVHGTSGGQSFDSGNIFIDGGENAFEILPGNWTFYAEAFNKDNQKIGRSDEVEANIKSGPGNHVSLTVREIEGVGDVTFNLTYTNQINPDTPLYVMIDDGEKQQLVVKDGVHVLTVSLSNGFHVVWIYEGDNENPSDVFTIRVVTGYPTTVTGEYVTSSAGDGYFDIEGDIVQTPEISFTSNFSTDNVPANLEFKLKAVVEGVSGQIEYTWFLDGIQVQDQTMDTFTVQSLESMEGMDVGSQHNLMLMIRSGSIVWTSDRYFFTVGQAVTLPTIESPGLGDSAWNTQWNYDGGSQTITINVNGSTDGFIIKYFIDDQEVVAEDNVITVDPQSYSIGQHELRFEITGYGLTRSGSLGRFMINPSVTLTLDKTSGLYNYDKLTGSVQVNPAGNYEFVAVEIVGSDGLVEPLVQKISLDESGHTIFEVSLGSLTTTGTYTVHARVADRDSNPTFEGLSEDQTIQVTVPDFSINTVSDKVYSGGSFSIYANETSGPGNSYVWYVNGEEVHLSDGQTGYSSFHVNNVSWPTGTYEIYLMRDGVKSNTITIEVVEEPRLGILINGSLNGNNWASGNAVRFEIWNPDGHELSEINWYVYADGPGIDESLYTIDESKQGLTVQENVSASNISVDVELKVDGISHRIHGSAYSSGDEYDNGLAIYFDKLVVAPGEGFGGNYTISYYMPDPEGYYQYPIETATVRLFGVKADGSEGIPIWTKEYSREDKTLPAHEEFNLNETTDEYTSYKVAIDFTYTDNSSVEPHPYDGEWTNSIPVSSERIIPIQAGDVYQMLQIDGADGIAVGLGTLILTDDGSNQYVRYVIKFSEDMIPQDPEQEMTEMPFEIEKGTFTSNGGSITFNGQPMASGPGGTGQVEYTVTINGNEFVDDDGRTWTRLNTETRSKSRAISDFNGSWKFADINLDSSFMTAMMNFVFTMMEQQTGEEMAMPENLLTFDEGEGIGVSLGAELHDGLLTMNAGIGLDATIMDGISLADDLMLLAGATGDIDSYGGDDLLTMDGYAIPLTLQLSSDESVMLLYVLSGDRNSGYMPMLVLPLSKVSSLDFPKATGSHFSKTMRSTMSEVMDMAKTAEQKLGSDGSDVLYNLFAVPLFNSNVSSTGKWNVEVTSGDTEFLERIFGGYMYSLMGSMTTGGGYEICDNYDPSDPSGSYHYSLAYGGGATSGYANFNVTSSGEDPNEVTMMVQVSFRGLPVYEGTLRLTRDTSLSFMEVCEEMVASSSGPSTGYIELRSNGEVWFGYGETEVEGMNICVGTYGLDGGKIVIETASDLLPELEGLSISFGGLFGYSQSGDTAEIMILQQKNGADFGLKFNAVG